MVDTPFDAEQPSPAGAAAGRAPQEVELAVAVASFLPEGVEVAAPESHALESDLPDGDPLEALETELDAVDAAIERLDAGTYGIDPDTGDPIDDALLAADPTRLTAGERAS